MLQAYRCKACSVWNCYPDNIRKQQEKRAEELNRIPIAGQYYETPDIIQAVYDSLHEAIIDNLYVDLKYFFQA